MKNKRKYKKCLHYDELVQVVVENRDIEDISFEIDDIRDCKECSHVGGVCELWFSLGTSLVYIEDLKSQMDRSAKKRKKKIPLQLVIKFEDNNDESNTI